MSHGYTKNVSKGTYRTKLGQIKDESKTVKDLGILTSKDVSFDEHLDKLVLSSNIKAGLLLRTFKTREAEPMIKMFNSYIRSKLDYYYLIWNPVKKEDINKIERIQRSFTAN